jgi:fructuronate reductase
VNASRAVEALAGLTEATCARLPATVQRPRYDRAATRFGVVHLGPGAFHRAHQAVYFDDLLAMQPQWAISAIALRSRTVRDALAAQDGLYTLETLEASRTHRVIGAVREILVAPDQREAVAARLSDPDVHLLTLTITEKGYCLAGDDLDRSHPGIVHDLAQPNAPTTAIGLVTAALRARRRQGIAPVTVLSCDNLADNGRRLCNAVVQFAAVDDPGLARWIEDHVAFPRSMVDSITPATDAALRDRVRTALGVVDAAPVQRERYTQWVVEDRFCGVRPPLEQVGVCFSDEIAGYDRAKLRLLNGAHSTLAYLGHLLGHVTVHEAMSDPALATFVARLLREDVAPSLVMPAGVDADRYIGEILDRFRNPAVRHALLQIAADGSQKLPVRLFGTLRDARAAGRRVDRLCRPIAAWMHFVRREAARGVAPSDPVGARLLAIGEQVSGDAAVDVARLLAVFPRSEALDADAAILSELRRAYADLGDGSAVAVRGALDAWS